MWKWVGIICFVALTGMPLAAEDEAAPPNFVVFDPPIEATVRTTDGRTAQGLLTWVEVDGAHLTSDDGRKLFFPVKRLKEIKTNRSQFAFRLNADNFLVSIQRARQLQPQPVVETAEEALAEPEPPAKSVTKPVLPETKLADTKPEPAEPEQANSEPKASDKKPNPAKKAFECSKCLYHVTADDATFNSFAFCPKCGANQSTDMLETPAITTPVTPVPVDTVPPTVMAQSTTVDQIKDVVTSLANDPANLVVIVILVGVIVTLAVSNRGMNVEQPRSNGQSYPK